MTTRRDDGSVFVSLRCAPTSVVQRRVAGLRTATAGGKGAFELGDVLTLSQRLLLPSSGSLGVLGGAEAPLL